MKVNEIFYSIEGEGIRTGYPCIFIRLYGCNLKCSYCDTRYSCEDEQYKAMTVDEILNELLHYNCHKVTITGGEPLIHDNINELIKILLKQGYEVNIETNGAVDISDHIIYDNLIITMDYKTTSSDMKDRMLLDNFHKLREQDVLKFVVGTEEDMIDMDTVLNVYRPKCNIFMSPIYGKIDMKDMVDFIKKHNYTDVRIQVQLHKIIWGVDERGV